MLKNGVPYEVAIALDEFELTAFSIAFGQLNGLVWDWVSMRFKERQ